MSRYLILVLLNIPLIVAGLSGSFIAYKLKTIGRAQFFARIAFWLFSLIALASVKPMYDFLFSNNLTQTEPLSLFDVIQITGILFAILITARAYTKVDLLQRQVQDLHQQLSIELSDQRTHKLPKRK